MTGSPDRTQQIGALRVRMRANRGFFERAKCLGCRIEAFRALYGSVQNGYQFFTNTNRGFLELLMHTEAFRTLTTMYQSVHDPFDFFSITDRGILAKIEEFVTLVITDRGILVKIEEFGTLAKVSENAINRVRLCDQHDTKRCNYITPVQLRISRHYLF